MAALLPIDVPWGQQKPPYGTKINRNHELLSEGGSVYLLNEAAGQTIYDSLGDNNGSYIGFGGTIGFATTSYGVGMQSNGSGTVVVQLANTPQLQLNSGTIAVWFSTSSPGTSFRGLFVKQDAYGLFLNSSVLIMYDWTASAARSTGVNCADGKLHCASATFRSGVANGTAIYLDGKPLLTTQITILDQTKPPVINNGGIGQAQCLNGTTYTGLITPALWTDAQHASYYAKPYNIAQPRRLWLPVGAATTFTPKFRRTRSELGTRIGSRQVAA